MEKIPIDGEMSAVLVGRYVNVSRAINCLCPTDQHFSGILWGSLRVTPHPTQKRPTLAAWCWDWTGISTDLTLWCTIHQEWRFDDVATRDLTMAYLVGHVTCSFQKAKAWCFWTYKQRIARGYTWHHVPRFPHTFSTCHFIEWKLVAILHHL